MGKNHKKFSACGSPKSYLLVTICLINIVLVAQQNVPLMTIFFIGTGSLEHNNRDYIHKNIDLKK